MIGKSSKVDNRVKQVLDGIGLKYTTVSDGDFRLIFDMGGGRSQVIFIRSSTNTYRNLEIRDVYSPAYESDGAIPANIANRLLEHNWAIKLGGWAKLGKYAVFMSKVDADADKEAMMSCIVLTAKAADEMEAELTGKQDKF